MLSLCFALFCSSRLANFHFATFSKTNLQISLHEEKMLMFCLAFVFVVATVIVVVYTRTFLASSHFVAPC